MHILVISDDMSYHFKFLELIDGKAFDILKDENDNLNIEKFIEWWFLPLKELSSFS